jgi:hypothetical protein
MIALHIYSNYLVCVGRVGTLWLIEIQPIYRTVVSTVWSTVRATAKTIYRSTVVRLRTTVGLSVHNDIRTL